MAWALTHPPVSRASISGSEYLNIDFSDSVDALAKAVWSRPEKVTVSKDGLGWKGDSTSSIDGWIETRAVAIGESWRVPSSAMVRIAIRPDTSATTLKGGQKFTQNPGYAYVRYSPDLSHWSSWQALQHSEPRSIEDKKTPARFYEGMVSIPQRERIKYENLLREYSRREVPWVSDEEAAVIWILSGDPDYFSKQLPFIGYVQFLYEVQLHGDERIRSFNATVSYGMGGKHQPPNNPDVYKTRMNMPWRFVQKK